MKDLAIAYSVKRQMKRGLPKLGGGESEQEAPTPKSIVEAIRAKKATQPQPAEDLDDELDLSGLDLHVEDEEPETEEDPASPLKARLADIMKSRGVKA